MEIVESVTPTPWAAPAPPAAPGAGEMTVPSGATTDPSGRTVTPPICPPPATDAPLAARPVRDPSPAADDGTLSASVVPAAAPSPAAPRTVVPHAAAASRTPTAPAPRRAPPPISERRRRRLR